MHMNLCELLAGDGRNQRSHMHQMRQGHIPARHLSGGGLQDLWFSEDFGFVMLLLPKPYKTYPKP